MDFFNRNYNFVMEITILPLFQEKYKFFNLDWSSKTRFGSWENGPQEKEGLNYNSNNNVRKTHFITVLSDVS